MKTYVILFLLLAIGIPMLVKYSIDHSADVTGGAGPCMINNFTNDSLQDRKLPKNLDNINKTDAFQPSLDNRPKDGMVNMDNFQENSSNRVGQKCEFGMCLPGQQQPGNRQD